MLKFSGSSCLIGGPNESGCVYAYVPNEQKETFGPPPPRRKKPRMPAHVLAESRVAGPPKKGQAKRRQQLLCGRAREASFTRLGALGETPEHSESAPFQIRPPPPAPPFHQRKSGIEREEKKKTGASGVNRHSDKHAPRSIPEAQDAFKVLMIHWILQVARRIAFRCVLHRCGSQDIRR